MRVLECEVEKRVGERMTPAIALGMMAKTRPQLCGLRFLFCIGFYQTPDGGSMVVVVNYEKKFSKAWIH